MNLSERGSAAGVATLIILLILLGGALYFLWLNLPGKPVELTFINSISSGEEFVNYSSSKQFYSNLRFPNREISYRIEPACGTKKNMEIQEAFSILESRTILDFYTAPQEEAEITIFCSEIAPGSKGQGYFVAGEGGPTEVINTTLYGVIFSGKVSFFRDERCNKPNIAIHEILHVLGFDHNDNPNSILFPTLNCAQTIDDSIIKDINALYSVKSAADLKIIDVDATKSGRYLNFEIEVINQGLRDADNVILSIYSDDKFVKEFDLESIGVGTRKFLTVENLRVSRSSEKIIFVIDESDVIDELFENNNVAELVLIEN